MLHTRPIVLHTPFLGFKNDFAFANKKVSAESVDTLHSILVALEYQTFVMNECRCNKIVHGCRSMVVNNAIPGLQTRADVG